MFSVVNHEPPKSEGPEEAEGQLIQASFGKGRPYTYRWRGEGDVKVGDRLLALLRNGVQRPVIVTEIGSDYDGDVISIDERAVDPEEG